MLRPEAGKGKRIPSLSISKQAVQASDMSDDEKKSSRSLPLADDVFQDPASGKFVVKGFKSKLNLTDEVRPYEVMQMSNGMYIYPWDSPRLKYFLEDDEDEDVGHDKCVFVSESRLVLTLRT